MYCLLWSFNDVVDADSDPVFIGKIAVSQSFFNTIIYLHGSYFLLPGTNALAFSRVRFCFPERWIEPSTQLESKAS